MSFVVVRQQKIYRKIKKRRNNRSSIGKQKVRKTPPEKKLEEKNPKRGKGKQQQSTKRPTDRPSAQSKDARKTNATRTAQRKVENKVRRFFILHRPSCCCCCLWQFLRVSGKMKNNLRCFRKNEKQLYLLWRTATTIPPQ